MSEYIIEGQELIDKKVDVYIGGRVKDRRTELGMSQSKLAANLGVTFQQVQKYEKGTNRISASTLFAIARILKVNWNYFVDGYQNATSLSDSAGVVYEIDRKKKREANELMKAYFKIENPKIRKKFLDLLKGFAATECESECEYQ